MSVPRIAPRGPQLYRGTIAGRPVVVRLTCDAGCRGYYFYEAIGRSVRLDEVALGTFDEVVGYRARSRVTGRLTFDGPPGAERWRGRWVAPGGDAKGASQPIELERVHRDAAPVWAARKLVEASAKHPECTVTIRSFELLGLADAGIEARVNAVFDPVHLAAGHLSVDDGPRGGGGGLSGPDEGPCGEDGTTCDDSADGARVLCRARDGRSGLTLDDEVHPTVLDPRLLSVRSEFGFDGGGVHPSDGVSGMSIDLRDGHLLGARDLLRDPSHPPDWAALASPSTRHDVDGEDTLPDVGLSLPEGGRAVVWLKEEWADFYLTPTGIALVPQVAEAFRVLRHDVREVPFAKLGRRLRPDGPAAHLYARDAGP